MVKPNYRPHAKQLLVHNAPVGWDELSIILYGGARGAGKSACALADAVMFATTYPGSKIVILRENLDAVKQSFLDKLPSLFPQEVYSEDGKKVKVYDYKEKSSSWYPSRSIIFENGSYITLQRVANLAEAKSKQGWEFNMLIIDEVTKQTKDTVTYLLSTVRSVIRDNPYTGKKIKIPTKILFGCNPGGVGHKWVKEMFIDTTVIEYDPKTNAPVKTKDHVYWMGDDGMQSEQKDEEDVKVTVRFIPASWRDNPFLSKAYKAMLLMQNDHMRAMDMDGNWDVVAGKMFDVKPEARIRARAAYNKVFNSKEVKDIYITIDWGFNPSSHAALWVAVFEDESALFFQEKYGTDQVFEDFVKDIHEKSRGLEIEATLLPHDMFRGGDRYRDSNGRIMGETKAEVFESYGLNPISVESGKGTVATRFDKIHSSMVREQPDGSPSFTYSESCYNLLDEYDNAVYAEDGSGKIHKSSQDHAIDAAGLFFVFYSSDIAPIEIIHETPDTRTKHQRMIDEDFESYYNNDFDDDYEL